MQSLPAEAGGRLWATLPDWRVKVWEYPDGREVAAYVIGWSETRGLSSRLLHCPPPLRTKRGQSSHREENRAFSVRRAKTMMRRRIRAGGFDRMLTLTYRENVTDRERVLSDWRRFTRRMRELFGEFAYVAVLELQARGAFHIHAAVKGYYHANVVRGVWWSIVGRGQGNIDLGRARKGGTQRVARYMAKYMGKSFADGRELNRKRYWSSEAINTKPALQFALEAGSFPADDVMAVVEEITPLMGGTTKSVWISDGQGVIWLSG